MSQTYRQSSEVRPESLTKDPDNRWLSRGPRVRLDAEVVRDQSLAVSGLLSKKRGGPSVFPPQPPNVTTEGTYGSLAWNVSAGEDRFRRSLYTFTKRTSPFALTATFDAPSGEPVWLVEISRILPCKPYRCLTMSRLCKRRVNLGNQSPTLKVMTKKSSPNSSAGFLVRPATKDEFRRVAWLLFAAAFATSRRTIAGPQDRNGFHIENLTNDDAVQRAAWTLVARVIMNLDEAVTK